jgi:type I restriction enzyme S subunit
MGDGAWGENKLEEIAEFLKGKGISKADIDDNGKLPCIRYGELYTIYTEVIKEIKSYTNLPSKDLFLSEENDVIIPSSGETREDIATASCVKIRGIALGGDLNILRSKSDGEFLAYYLSHGLKKAISKIAQGDAVVHLYSNQLKKLIAFFPPKISEQQKIAACLSSLDTLISAESQKLELLKTHKKGLLQNLFPQAGESVPRLRFEEFVGSGDWEEKMLGEVCEFLKGKGISKADIAENGMHPCIRYGELYTFYGEIISEIKSFTNLPPDDLFLSKVNDVIIPSSGETREDIATASCVKIEGVALGGDLNVLRTNLNGSFLAYYLSHGLKKSISKIAQGDAVVHLYSSSLKNINLSVPQSQQEQQKIADFISSLDDLISAQGKKLEALKRHKQGLLQGLFPLSEL